jgi:hypothetical protein
MWRPRSAHPAIAPAARAIGSAPLHPGQARPCLPFAPIGSGAGADDPAAGADHARGPKLGPEKSPAL